MEVCRLWNILEAVSAGPLGSACKVTLWWPMFVIVDSVNCEPVVPLESGFITTQIRLSSSLENYRCMNTKVRGGIVGCLKDANTVDHVYLSIRKKITIVLVLPEAVLTLLHFGMTWRRKLIPEVKRNSAQLSQSFHLKHNQIMPVQNWWIPDWMVQNSLCLPQIIMVVVCVDP